jgi:hypothetical protein
MNADAKLDAFLARVALGQAALDFDRAAYCVDHAKQCTISITPILMYQKQLSRGFANKQGVMAIQGLYSDRSSTRQNRKCLENPSFIKCQSALALHFRAAERLGQPAQRAGCDDSRRP